MKKRLLILLLLAMPALTLLAQPGSVRAEIERAVIEAVERWQMDDGHFYAKCKIERRWLSSHLENHSTVALKDIDDTPAWYQFWRKKGVQGFWFDLKTGSDLGMTSQLDGNLLTSMRRALLHPLKAAVGREGDTVLYCMVEHSSYDAERLDRWMNEQCDILVPWVCRHSDGTVSMAFVPIEQSELFRQANRYDDYEQFLREARRPLASYHVDFGWYNKTNFLIESEGIRFIDSLFSTVDAENLTTTLVKCYDQLHVWENGFFRGSYALTRLPNLTTLWKEMSALQSPHNPRSNIKSIRTLPFDEKRHRTLLSQCEDSLFLCHRRHIDSTGVPDKNLLDNYFRIYDKQRSSHANEIEQDLFAAAQKSMDWGSYYLQTYTQRQGRHYDSIDDVSFAIVLSDFSQVQAYRNLFPLGRHLGEADEIVTFQKACRLYDPEIYLSKYPSGRYIDRFNQYMASEEQRLYNEGVRIYEYDNAPDIESALMGAVTPYLQYFPKGTYLRQVNEMYYYGIAVQRRNAQLYGSHYPLKTPRGRHLKLIIANPYPEGISYESQPDIPTPVTTLHNTILALPVSQYIDYQHADDGSFLVTAIHLALSDTPGKGCLYEQPYSLTARYDSYAGTFYILQDGERKHQSGTLFQTIKQQLLEGYDNRSGTLYNIEQWILANCPHLSSGR